jgi:hypothetical protein
MKSSILKILLDSLFDKTTNEYYLFSIAYNNNNNNKKTTIIGIFLLFQNKKSDYHIRRNLIFYCIHM